MGAYITIGIIISLFLIAGIALLLGKGSFLIAGYNTATKEEKAQYDEKKLCRSMGMVCMLLVVMLALMGYQGYRVDMGLMEEKEMLPFAMFFIVVVLGAVVVEIIYANKACKKKKG